ncbi:MAG: NTP transferase domain-containing protein [Phaeodactylibacter sp.]|nr:NTP transferase domain-containing protein [Phaeodactylibacter sp.]
MPNSDKKHRKHAKLTRPSLGHFHRNEWAIIGTPCGNIQQLAYAIIDRLSEIFNIGYVDADHANEDDFSDFEGGMKHGAQLNYTDKTHFHRFDERAKFGTHQLRARFNHLDAVVVNGNHFHAKRQIVVIDPKKENSLRKKLDRLTNVRLILLAEGVSEPYPWLKASLEGFSNIPQMKLEDQAGIPIFVEKELKTAVPPLKGLVLAGGKSQRMGEDKGLIAYHNRPQREYIADLVSRYCIQTYLSCRQDQAAEVANPLTDTFIGLGPFGGILSAFRQDPDAAWLVIACDLPLMDSATLSQLVGYRNTSKTATTFNSPVTGFPEPLITIWEPRAYPLLLQFLAQGYACPRKVLINSEIELLNAEHPEALRNVNSPEEREEVLKIIKERTV